MSRLTASSISAWVDGPERLALGEPDQALELVREVENRGRLGVTRWLTRRTAIRPASSPTSSSRYS